MLECRGRIQGEYPIFLPDSALYTFKLVQRAHVTTLHGGVGLTMAKVREVQWVPRLRQLTKRDLFFILLLFYFFHFYKYALYLQYNTIQYNTIQYLHYYTNFQL